jgi:hypothetical protein
MKTMNFVCVGGLLFTFAACASTNNGGHVVGNPIISEGTSSKMKDDTKKCDCASSKDPKVKAACKCAVDAAPACKDGDKNCAK